MHTMASRYLNKAKEIINGECVPKEAASPLNLHWGYWAAVHFTQLCQEVPNLENTKALEIVKEALMFINNRWKAAGEYTATMFFYCNDEPKLTNLGSYLNILNARSRVPEIFPYMYISYRY